MLEVLKLRVETPKEFVLFSKQNKFSRKSTAGEILLALQLGNIFQAVDLVPENTLSNPMASRSNGVVFLFSSL